MPLRLGEPSWWYGANRFGLRQVLYPASFIYGAITARRMALQPAYTPSIPVICVGNFVAGGSGKSPMVSALVERLRARGLRPAILSQGYRGTLTGPVWVDPTVHSFTDVGDEPLMLAAGAPVMVAHKRAEGARAIAESGVADVIVMDDGLQNPTVAKSLTIAVVNGTRGLGNGNVIPSGPLRASLGAQLRYVDAIVVTQASEAPVPALADIGWYAPLGPHAPGLIARVAAKPIGALPPDTPVVVFAAIANPERVFTSARSLPLAVAATRAFPDHHAFSDQELSELSRVAAATGAALVTTEKDMARLRTGSPVARALAARTHVIAIELGFSPEDEGLLDALLDGLVRKA